MTTSIKNLPDTKHYPRATLPSLDIRINHDETHSFKADALSF